MALLLLRRCCRLLLVLAACHIAAVLGECSKDCATCAYRQGTHTDINPLCDFQRLCECLHIPQLQEFGSGQCGDLDPDYAKEEVQEHACTLECEGKLPSSKAWDTCKELLQLIKLDVVQQDGENDQDIDANHLLAKKYGGFMKRYGGFMKKMDELYRVEPEEENNGEILTKRYGGFMKKDSDGEAADLLRELLGTGIGDNPEAGHYRDSANESQGEVSKRYGGFMRGVRRSSEMEEGAKELHKRYGGFMRRVGRPEWWLDYQKRYGGFMRRSTDSSAPSEEEAESYSKEIPEMEKRYGGFMRY